ncbi:hypothetical protein DYB28_006825, partial [Aphanomyces astaci]
MLVNSVHGVQFDIPTRVEKCLSDEVAKDSFVLIQYDVLGNAQGRTGVSVMIQDPLGKYIKEDSDVDVSSGDLHKF